jgi:hypothetical protein
VQTIGYYWWKTRRDKLETTLKLEMVQRGMSADEIAKVLKVSGRKTESGPSSG